MKDVLAWLGATFLLVPVIGIGAAAIGVLIVAPLTGIHEGIAMFFIGLPTMIAMLSFLLHTLGIL